MAHRARPSVSFMKRLVFVAAAMMMALGTAACADVGDPTQGTQGGANTNDRSNGGDDGEKLLTGAMTISPNGKYILAARSDLTIVVDVQAVASKELAFKADRWVFSKTRDVAYAMLANRAGVVAIDLHTGEELWKVMPAFVASDGATLAKVTNDDHTLVVGDYERVFFIDTEDGNIRATAKVGQRPVDLEILPNDKSAVVVGATSWATGKPLTPVSLVDLTTHTSSSIEIPNC
jgi:outer membrane protein assembly factor BamB